MVTTPANYGEVGSHGKRSGVVPDNLLRNIALEFEKGPVEDLKSVVAKAQIEAERESLEKQLENALRAAENEISRIKDAQPDADVSGLTAAANALAFALEDVKLAKNTGTLPTVTANFANTVLSKFESENSSAKANATFMDGAAGAEYYNEVVAQYILAPGGRMDQRREFHRETTSNVRNILGADYERHYGKFAKAADRHFAEADRWRDKATAAFKDGDKVAGYGHTATALTHQAKGVTSHIVGLGVTIHRLEKELGGLDPESEEHQKKQEQIRLLREQEEKARAEFARARAEKEMVLRNQANAMVERGEMKPEEVGTFVEKGLKAHDTETSKSRTEEILKAPPEFQREYVMSRTLRDAERRAEEQGLSGAELEAFVLAEEKKAAALFDNKDTRSLAIARASEIESRRFAKSSIIGENGVEAVRAVEKSGPLVADGERLTATDAEKEKEKRPTITADLTEARSFFAPAGEPKDEKEKRPTITADLTEARSFFSDDSAEVKARKAAKEVVSTSEETKQVSKAEGAKVADTGKLAVKSTPEGDPSKVAAAKKETPTAQV